MIFVVVCHSFFLHFFAENKTQVKNKLLHVFSLKMFYLVGDESRMQSKQKLKMS